MIRFSIPKKKVPDRPIRPGTFLSSSGGCLEIVDPESPVDRRADPGAHLLCLVEAAEVVADTGADWADWLPAVSYADTVYV